MNKEFSKLKEVILYFIIVTAMYVCVFYIISICIVYCIFTTRRHTIIKDLVLVLLYKKSYPTSNTFHTSLIKILKKE